MEKLYSVPRPLMGLELQKYFMQFVDRAPVHGWHFYRVHTDIPAFKKGRTLESDIPTIINLIIPAGSVIHAGFQCWDRSGIDNRKMRATAARVHSIVLKSQSMQVQQCISLKDAGFLYTKGKLVTPTEKFDYTHTDCASGIHFFLNISDAYYYTL